MSSNDENPSPVPRLGYCTNVHPGTSLAAVRANLTAYAVPVRDRMPAQARPLGVGLWLPARAAREALTRHEAEAFGAFLAGHGLTPFTFNGFPYGDFHRDRVKHDVYRPDWLEDKRLEYTKDLVRLAAVLLPPGATCSISTLPLGWPDRIADETSRQRCAASLLEAARFCAETVERTGRRVRLALEPEPGCALQRSDDAVAFFRGYLFGAGGDDLVRRHLGICHDVCHAAVMGETQKEALRAYAEAGVPLQKVQLSSALVADFTTAPTPSTVRRALEAFAEPRYLHQTRWVRPDDSPRFYEDLPDALAAEEDAGVARVHFHVPLHLRRLRKLGTTQDAVGSCLRCLQAPHSGHAPEVEVETYAWGVLPAALRPRRLVDGLAAELTWARARLPACC